MTSAGVRKKCSNFQVLFPYKEPTFFFTQFQLRSCPCSLYSCKNNLPRTLNAKCHEKILNENCTYAGRAEEDYEVMK